MRRHEAMVKALLTGIELRGRIGVQENPSVVATGRSAGAVISPFA
jgi:hypothetical protein